MRRRRILCEESGFSFIFLLLSRQTIVRVYRFSCSASLGLPPWLSSVILPAGNVCDERSMF